MMSIQILELKSQGVTQPINKPVTEAHTSHCALLYKHEWPQRKYNHTTETGL